MSGHEVVIRSGRKMDSRKGADKAVVLNEMQLMRLTSHPYIRMVR
jgi:hypothetical protein